MLKRYGFSFIKVSIEAHHESTTFRGSGHTQLILENFNMWFSEIAYNVKMSQNNIEKNHREIRRTE
jgi:hypothetical protein